MRRKFRKEESHVLLSTSKLRRLKWTGRVNKHTYKSEEKILIRETLGNPRCNFEITIPH
jgi:hypothetical protein